MEQSSKIQKNRIDQNRISNIHAIEGLSFLIFQTNAEAIFKNSFKGQDESFNIFLIQNRGKGPPGGWDSPVAVNLLLPDYLHTVCNGSKNITHKNFTKSPNTNFQIFITNQFLFTIKFPVS